MKFHYSSSGRVLFICIDSYFSVGCLSFPPVSVKQITEPAQLLPDFNKHSFLLWVRLLFFLCFLGGAARYGNVQGGSGFRRIKFSTLS